MNPNKAVIEQVHHLKIKSDIQMCNKLLRLKLIKQEAKKINKSLLLNSDVRIINKALMKNKFKAFPIKKV